MRAAPAVSALFVLALTVRVALLYRLPDSAFPLRRRLPGAQQDGGTPFVTVAAAGATPQSAGNDTALPAALPHQQQTPAGGSATVGAAAGAIPHQFLFLYGLWDALPHNYSCAFDGVEPPPCARLSAQAHLLPAPVALQLRAWASRYPAWPAFLVNRAGLGQLLAARFPSLAATLEALPTGVQRSDLARLLLLAAWGGVYADADAAPAGGDLAELLASHAHASALFFEEALLSPAQAAAAAAAHPVRRGVPEARQRIANYFMAAAPGEACIRAALEEALARVRSRPALAPADADYEVLWTTGPDALTDAVHRMRGWALDGSDIVGTARLVEGSGIETPRRAAESGPPHPCAVVPRPLDQQYISHAAAGTWKGARS